MTDGQRPGSEVGRDADGNGVSAQARAVLGSSRGRAVIAAAVLGSALAYMSDDMLNVALPTVSRDLEVGITQMQWVVNAYFIAMLPLILMAGSIGDIKGHRRSFVGGLGVFTSGALASAFAPGVPVLVLGRALQGVGAAFVLASGLALVSGSFVDDERGRALGIYMGLTAVATAAGPVLGGVLVEVFSWRAIFVAPLVFPIAAVLVTATRVPESPRASHRRPDGIGAGLAFVTISSFSFVLIQGPSDWSRPEFVGALALACIAGFAFLWVEGRRPDPMLPLHLFRIRSFSGGNAVTLIAYMVSAGVFFFVVVQMQTTLGYSPSRAGAALVPLYVIMLIGSPQAGRLADRVGARLPVTGGLCLLAVGVWWLSGVQTGSAFWRQVFPGLMVLSVGLALLGAPLTAATLGSVGNRDQGIASGVNNTVGQLAGLLMIVVLPAVAGLSGEALHGPGFSDGYGTAMRVCALLSLIAAGLAALTIPRTSGFDLHLVEIEDGPDAKIQGPKTQGANPLSTTTP